MEDFKKYRKMLDEIHGYVYALCEIKADKRIPFYIGKGKGDRCLQHLKELKDSEKSKKINELIERNLFGIDIIRHGIKNDNVLSEVESTCIDLIGVSDLTNKVRGRGTATGRISIEELELIVAQNYISIRKEHKGIAFLLNDTYLSGMSSLQLFECTRGVWKNPPKNDTSFKYAYAVYKGIIKEVYEIKGWVKAGENQYFTRSFENKDISNRWEFIGVIAPNEIRKIYCGKLIEKNRSFGSPFVKVGN